MSFFFFVQTQTESVRGRGLISEGNFTLEFTEIAEIDKQFKGAVRRTLKFDTDGKMIASLQLCFDQCLPIGASSYLVGST